METEYQNKEWLTKIAQYPRSRRNWHGNYTISDILKILNIGKSYWRKLCKLTKANNIHPSLLDIIKVYDYLNTLNRRTKKSI